MSTVSLEAPNHISVMRLRNNNVLVWSMYPKSELNSKVRYKVQVSYTGQTDVEQYVRGCMALKSKTLGAR